MLLNKLLQLKLIKSFQTISAYHLRHEKLSSFCGRHFLKKNSHFSHHGCSNNPTLISTSIVSSSRTKAQCIQAFSWIDTEFSSKRSYVQFRAQFESHKQSGIHPKGSIRMVWISDLDNKVFECILPLYSFDTMKNGTNRYNFALELRFVLEQGHLD